MTLVDSSVWIDLLRLGANPMPPEHFLEFAICGPILQEVLQGLPDDSRAQRLRWNLLALPALSDPVPLALYSAAADIYRRGRVRGYTVRSPHDCLIAAIAIENHVPVWHQDRDFDTIARFTTLQATRHLSLS